MGAHVEARLAQRTEAPAESSKDPANDATTSETDGSTTDLAPQAEPEHEDEAPATADDDVIEMLD